MAEVHCAARVACWTGTAPLLWAMPLQPWRQPPPQHRHAMPQGHGPLPDPLPSRAGIPSARPCTLMTQYQRTLPSSDLRSIH